jgi:hypothetical protein
MLIYSVFSLPLRGTGNDSLPMTLASQLLTLACNSCVQKCTDINISRFPRTCLTARPRPTNARGRRARGLQRKNTTEESWPATARLRFVHVNSLSYVRETWAYFIGVPARSGCVGPT